MPSARPLRFYFDWQPQVKVSSPAGDSSLAWSRLLLAWSFDFKVPVDFKFLANRVDLLPRLGGWSFATRLPILVNEEEKIGSFSLKNKLSTGVEIGAEKDWDRLSARLWYGRDIALSLFGLLGSKSVTSDRFGLDLWWEGFPKGATSLLGQDLGVSFLAFSFFEDVALEDSGIGQPENPGEAAIVSVGYYQAFTGVGMALTW